MGGLSTSGRAEVQTAGAVALDNITVNGGSFIVSAGSAISQVAGKNISVSGLGGFISSGAGANGDIALNNAGNNFGSFGVISANGSAVSMREASDTALDTVTVNNGTLSITSAGGITQVAGRVITSGGAATFAAAPGSDTMKVVPWPRRLVARTAPFMACARCLTMAATLLLCSPLFVARNWYHQRRKRYPLQILTHHLVADRIFYQAPRRPGDEHRRDARRYDGDRQDEKKDARVQAQRGKPQS